MKSNSYKINPLIRQADSRWRKVVVGVDGGKCAMTGGYMCFGAVECHHIVTRRYKSLRWEPENGIALCRHHHLYDADLSPHASPKGFKAWLKSQRPWQYEWIESNKNKMDVPMLEDKLVELDDLIQALLRGYKPVWGVNGMTLEK